jgi:hypothetical protein
MGLDMYAYTVKAELIGDQQVDIKLHNPDGDRLYPEDTDMNFAYWRKFNNLHQWMSELYYAKGGTVSPFNCVTVRLMPDDLDRLRLEAPGLQPRSGFFWGEETEMSLDDIQRVYDFVDKSKQAIAEGKAVLYDSWW